VIPRAPRRLAALLLVAGAAAAAFAIVPSMPRDHHVDLRLDDPASVTSVEVAWSPAPSGHGNEAAEAVQGGAWHFQPGKAPQTLGTRVHLPDGTYELGVLVERGSGRDAFRRTISLGEADHITVPLTAPRAEAHGGGAR
jgi:hypothetical protein